MARNAPIPCPVNETCDDDNCIIGRCLAEIREKNDAVARREEQNRLARLNAKDRREAGRRAIGDMIAELNAERSVARRPLFRPSRREREELIDKVLASEKQAARVQGLFARWLQHPDRRHSNRRSCVLPIPAFGRVRQARQGSP